MERDRNWHPYDDLTPETYQVPKGEERYFHVVLESPNYDQSTGQRLSKPILVKWNNKEGIKELEVAKFQKMLKIKILHDPNKWLEERMAEQKKGRKSNDKDAEIARLKAELAQKEKELNAAIEAEARRMMPEQPEAKAEETSQEQAEPAEEVKDIVEYLNYDEPEREKTPEETQAAEVAKKYKRKK